MSFKRSSSIYMLITLLLIVGIFAFAFRDPVLSFLSSKVFGEENTSTEKTLKPSAGAAIELQLLDRDDFQALDNHIHYFDFNVVGKPVAQNGVGGNLPTWEPVYRGNFNPFFKKQAVVITESDNQ